MTGTRVFQIVIFALILLLAGWLLSNIYYARSDSSAPSPIYAYHPDQEEQPSLTSLGEEFFRPRVDEFLEEDLGQQSSLTQVEQWQKDWRENPPTFEKQPVVAVFAIQPQNHDMWQLLNPKDATTFIEELSRGETLRAPSADTKVGAMIVTPTERTYLYFSKPTASQQEWVEKTRPEGIRVVDIFQLLRPEDVVQVEFQGRSLQTGQPVTLALDSRDPQDIDQFLRAARRLSIGDMELVEPQELEKDRITLQDSQEFYCILHLSSLYEDGWVALSGDGKTMRAHLSMQYYDRVYQVDESIVQRFLQEVSVLESVEVESQPQPSVSDFTEHS